MWDLLTFPTGAVNFCLSMHLQDWLSVWSEQLQAKCVCQWLPPSLLPWKDQKDTPQHTHTNRQMHTQHHTPTTTTAVPLTLHIPPPHNHFISFSYDSSTGKPTIKDFDRRLSVWNMHNFEPADISFIWSKKEWKNESKTIYIFQPCEVMLSWSKSCSDATCNWRLDDPYDVNEHKLLLLMLNG